MTALFAHEALFFMEFVWTFRAQFYDRAYPEIPVHWNDGSLFDPAEHFDSPCSYSGWTTSTNPNMYRPKLTFATFQMRD